MGNNDLKKERFIRIAENRTNKIISMIKLLGNCSNRNNYSYSDDDIKKIFSAIELELRMAKSKFNEVQSSDKKFRLR